MNFKRRCISVLDRPGGRWLLTALANQWVRALAGKDAGVCYDGMWLHRVGGCYLPDSGQFAYYKESVRKWSRTLAAMIRESEDCWFYVYKPKMGDTILDIGAGTGSDTLVFSRSVGDTGKVFSIEAHPGTYETLCKTVKWNRLTNVSAFCCAIIDASKPVFVEDRTNHVSNAVCAEPAPGFSIAGVQGVSLDEFCESRRTGSIDFLKMNIEGAETLAIRGMNQVLSLTRHACVACHDFLDPAGGNPNCVSKEAVINCLKKSGFTVTTRDADPRPWVRDHVHAVRPGG